MFSIVVGCANLLLLLVHGRSSKFRSPYSNNGLDCRVELRLPELSFTEVSKR